VAEEVNAAYRRSAPDLGELGRRLYAWLDGPTKRWLEQARQGVPGLAVHVDVEERLRHLPCELLCDAAGFLCSDPAVHARLLGCAASPRSRMRQPPPARPLHGLRAQIL
jgi:hypothetical protein